MGIGAFSSSSSASDNRQSGTDQARVLRGVKQYTESGSISVGQKGSYVEAGGVNLDGQKVVVQKGATLTLNQAPQGSQPTTPTGPGLTPVDVPSSPAPASTTAPASTATSTTGASLLQTLQGYWANFSIWQKLGAGTVLVLTLWLVFHKRR